MNAARLIVSSLAYTGLAILTLMGAVQYASERRAKEDATQQQIEALQDAVSRLQADLATHQHKKAPKKPRAYVLPGRPDPSLTYAVPVEGSPSLGPKTAPVTVVEFVDFQCPFCKRAQGTLKQLREEYGDQVRVVFKHMPLAFHEGARPAAIAAECAAEQGSFWPMSEALWEESLQLNHATFMRLATQLELNMSAFSACLEDERPAAKVAQDMALAKRFGVRGTPSFFINGRFLQGAQPLAQFRARIDEVMPPAKRFFPHPVSERNHFDPRGYYEAVVLTTGLTSVE